MAISAQVQYYSISHPEDASLTTNSLRESQTSQNNQVYSIGSEQTPHDRAFEFAKFVV